MTPHSRRQPRQCTVIVAQYVQEEEVRFETDEGALVFRTSARMAAGAL